MPPPLNGYLRNDGGKGIRNVIVVVYLVECAHHVAREIVFPSREEETHLLGFPGCFPNAYAHRILTNLCTHPNVGGVLLVSLGCEGFDRALAPQLAPDRFVSLGYAILDGRGGTVTYASAGHPPG